jgi:dienelactone hydrolase
VKHKDAAATDLWDLAAIRETPLDVQVLREWRVGRGPLAVIRRELRYHSHDWAQGSVTIAAQIALPTAPRPVPAMVLGTGDAEAAEAFCRHHRVAVILIDRPGTGESTGPEDLYTNWVTFDDPRESWMWHYVNAALRAVTLAQALPEVDPERIGITGGSRGGTMAWIANGVDDRLKLAIPVATGGDIVRALEHGGWAANLYERPEGQSDMPPEFYRFAKSYDPIHYMGKQKGPVVLIVGAQDEFFPLYCTGTSVRASAADDFRLLLLANWDHGYFAGDNPQVQAFNNTREVAAKQGRTIRAAIDAALRDGPPLPTMPSLRVEPFGGEVEARVEVDDSLPIRRVRLFKSTDSGYTFRGRLLRPRWDGFAGRLRLNADDLSPVAVFAEVEYTRGPFLTSAPWLGPGFRQTMRPFPEEP